MKKFWIIICVKNKARKQVGLKRFDSIPKSDCGSVFHESESGAMIEAERLTKKTKSQFVVMESRHAFSPVITVDVTSELTR